MADFGITFSPATDRRDANGRSTEPVQAPQGAIETRNYSLPKFLGASSPSPLVSQTAVGSPFSSAVLASVFKTVLGSGANAGSSFASPASASPIASPGRDTGITDFASSNVPTPPQPTAPRAPQTSPTLPSGPAIQPSVPQFQGVIDTPPRQGPPLFDQNQLTAQGGSGNAWETLLGGSSDDRARQQQLDWISQLFAQAEAARRGATSNGLPASIHDNAQNDSGGSGGSHA